MLFSYRDHTVDVFGLLDPRQVESDTTDDIWDHRVDYGTVDGEHDGTGFGCASLLPYSHVSSCSSFSTIAGSLSPDVNSHASAQSSTFDE